MCFHCFLENANINLKCVSRSASDHHSLLAWRLKVRTVASTDLSQRSQQHFKYSNVRANILPRKLCVMSNLFSLDFLVVKLKPDKKKRNHVSGIKPEFRSKLITTTTHPILTLPSLCYLFLSPPATVLYAQRKPWGHDSVYCDLYYNSGIPLLALLFYFDDVFHLYWVSSIEYWDCKHAVILLPWNIN